MENAELFPVRRYRLHHVEKFKLGDVIDFTLQNGEKMKAMMMRNTGNGAIFCCMDCLNTLYPMNGLETNIGGWNKSLLREILNSVILKQFPSELAQKMKPFSNGDMIRIPTEMEITGTNFYSSNESPEIFQWGSMKNRRNVLSFQRNNSGVLAQYWLKNTAKNDNKSFCYIGKYGIPDTGRANAMRGVRLVFKVKLKEPAQKNEAEENDEI